MMLRFSLLSSVALSLLSTAAYAQSYGRVITFGDSHSDNGNSLPIYGFTQAAPHVNGRLTNGLVWSEILASRLNNYRGVNGSMDRAGLTSLVTDPVNNSANVNYATAAWRGDGMYLQVDNYKNHGGTYGAKDLVTVAFGSNDVSNAIANGATAGTINGLMATASGTMAAQMQVQIGQGARNFLVLNLHDRGDAPFFAGTPSEALARQASVAFNSSFNTQINQLAAANSNANIIQMNLYGLQKSIQSNPNVFGFISSTLNCRDIAGCTSSSMSNQNQYFRWDQYHYTQAGHEIIARAAQITLNYGKDIARSHTIADTGLITRLGNMNAAFDKIAQARTHGGFSAKGEVSLEALGEMRSTISSDNRDASTTQLSGAKLTMAKAITHNIAIGGSATFQSGKVSQGNIAYDTTQLSLDAFASYEASRFFVNGVAGFANGAYNNWNRNHGLGDLVNKGSTTGKSMSAAVEIGRRYFMPQFAFTPLMRLSGLSTNIAAFTEEGVLSPLVFNARQSNMFVASSEMRFDRNIAGMTAHGLVGAQVIVKSTGNDVTGNLANNTSQAQTTTVGAAQINGVYLGAGINKMFTKTIGMGLDYRGLLSSDAQHKFNGGVKVAF